MPVLEDLSQVTSDQQPVDKPSPADSVANVAFRQRLSVLLAEAVFVNPEPVGPPPLFVNKTIGRFPCGDLALPSNRYAVPRFIEMGAGVNTSKRSHGGVKAERL